MPLTFLPCLFFPFDDGKKELLHPQMAKFTSTPDQGDADESETTNKRAFQCLYQLY